MEIINQTILALEVLQKIISGMFCNVEVAVILSVFGIGTLLLLTINGSEK